MSVPESLTQIPFATLATAEFVGLPFYLSLFFLWLMIQAFIWLAERYSRLSSETNWWRAGIIAFLSTILIVVGWGVPTLITKSEHMMHSMTVAMIFGAVGTWFLCGYLYNFEFVHRIIVSIGVPLLAFFAIAMGLVVGQRFG